jgi:hypothetical protein
MNDEKVNIIELEDMLKKQLATCKPEDCQMIALCSGIINTLEIRKIKKTVKRLKNEPAKTNQ